MNAFEVDLDLVRKYNVAGPRYTSYPPATRFQDDLPMEWVEREIQARDAGDRDLSLYFHLPFCRSLCWFCGCNTVITTDQNASATYLRYLRKELALVQSLLSSKRKVGQWHLGGGTPTFFKPDEIRALGEAVHEMFEITGDCEAGVEIDPRSLSREHVMALREVGFNRASMGVQDHNAVVQRAVHRIQPFAQTKMAIDWVRSAGFNSINVDLIYGLPHQSVASFSKTLDEILVLQPDRLAIFGYAHVPWIKPAQSKLAESGLPSTELRLSLFKLAVEKLTSAGYVHIGMDHFARPEDELAVAQRHGTLQRNFQGYSTRGGADLFAFGMSAISQTENLYWQNHKKLPAYYQALDQGKLPLTRGYVLDKDDKIRRHTIMRLMCDLNLDFAKLSEELGIDFPGYFGRELAAAEPFEFDGLIERTPDGLAVSDSGRLFIRNIAMCFDGRCVLTDEKQHSKTL